MSYVVCQEWADNPYPVTSPGTATFSTKTTCSGRLGLSRWAPFLPFAYRAPSPKSEFQGSTAGAPHQALSAGHGRRRAEEVGVGGRGGCGWGADAPSLPQSGTLPGALPRGMAALPWGESPRRTRPQDRTMGFTRRAHYGKHDPRIQLSVTPLTAQANLSHHEDTTRCASSKMQY